MKHFIVSANIAMGDRMAPMLCVRLIAQGGSSFSLTVKEGTAVLFEGARAGGISDDLSIRAGLPRGERDQVFAITQELVDLAGEAGGLIMSRLEEVADEFNKRLAARSFTGILDLFKVRDRMTYDQARTVIDEFFVCRLVHDQ